METIKYISHKLEDNIEDIKALSLYFDQIDIVEQNHIHIVAPFDAKPNAKGLITISSFNRYRDVAQGIYRMRKINQTQSIDYFITSKNARIISKRSKINAIDILLYTIKKEELYKDSQNDLFIKQNILACYRYYFISQNPPKYSISELSENTYIK